MTDIWGIGLDDCGRCVHYHGETDIAALLCARCRRYYACYQCHDNMEDHLFVPTDETEPYPVLCGRCRHVLSYEQYQSGACPFCGHSFNPRCARHHCIYFRRSSDNTG